MNLNRYRCSVPVLGAFLLVRLTARKSGASHHVALVAARMFEPMRVIMLAPPGAARKLTALHPLAHIIMDMPIHDTAPARWAALPEIYPSVLCLQA